MFWTVACFSLPVPWPSVWETSKTLILVTKSFERFDGKVITKHIIETAIISKNSFNNKKGNQSGVLVSWTPITEHEIRIGTGLG